MMLRNPNCDTLKPSSLKTREKLSIRSVKNDNVSKHV